MLILSPQVLGLSQTVLLKGGCTHGTLHSPEGAVFRQAQAWGREKWVMWAGDQRKRCCPRHSTWSHALAGCLYPWPCTLWLASPPEFWRNAMCHRAASSCLWPRGDHVAWPCSAAKTLGTAPAAVFEPGKW